VFNEPELAGRDVPLRHLGHRLRKLDGYTHLGAVIRQRMRAA